MKNANTYALEVYRFTRESVVALARFRLLKVAPSATRFLAAFGIAAFVLFGVSHPASALNATPAEGEAETLVQDRFEQVADKPVSAVARAVAEALAERRDALERRTAFAEEARLLAYFEAVDAKTFMWPTTGIFTSEFGMRWGAMHWGTDINTSMGTPIWASRAGTVVSSHYDGGYGNKVVIDHGDGTQTVYAHNQSNLVNVGEGVAKGQTIALVGSTGDSSGPHVHFEVYINGVRENPRSHVRDQ